MAPSRVKKKVVSAAASRKKQGNSGADRAGEKQRNKVRALYDAVRGHDFAALHDLAYEEGGFCSAELRRSIWSMLLGMPRGTANNPEWRSHLAEVEHDEKQARVMHADIQRSAYSWDAHTGMQNAARNTKRFHLSEVMHAILKRHSQKFTYFQGFHDIVLVFLELGTPNQAFHMAERLALFHLSDQLCWPFEKALTPLLRVLFVLLELVAPQVAMALREAECEELHVAVPWVLTWFAHSLKSLHHQVMRLYDCLLCSHPAMILYFSAALLTMHQDEILQAERDLPGMITVLQGIQFADIKVDDWAMKARHLFWQLPPDELLAKLPRELRSALPSTSPLFHYPHPWMRDGVPPELAQDALREAAPIYTGASPSSGYGNARVLQWLFPSKRPRRRLVRAVAVTGVALVFALSTKRLWIR